MHRCVLSWAIGLLLVLGLTLQSSSKPEPIDTGGWDLSQFVQSVQAGGLNLSVVPARQDGNIGNSAYLTEDSGANWLALQMKTRSVTCLEQWQGTVWVEALPLCGGIEWHVEEWGANGCQIGRFVLFGDAALIDRIVKTLKR
ncbi:MAG TPA: hypothetical protein VGY58_20880 [Gemmataceae bacterium]|jgi:hypothetical protein|nr:hypothetical protein [Gemmataceae bacterium]